MVGAVHAGEICRVIMLKAIEEKLLFSGNVPEKLNHPNSFSPNFLFEIDRDPPQLFYAAELILRERFKVNLIRRSDLVIVRYICRCVIQRAANLAGAACACLINRIGRRRVTVAVDGAYFRFSTMFPALLVETITQLVPYSFTFKLKLTEDGHGRGLAAILAQKKTQNCKEA